MELPPPPPPPESDDENSVVHSVTNEDATQKSEVHVLETSTEVTDTVMCNEHVENAEGEKIPESATDHKIGPVSEDQTESGHQKPVESVNKDQIEHQEDVKAPEKKEVKILEEVTSEATEAKEASLGNKETEKDDTFEEMQEKLKRELTGMKKRTAPVAPEAATTNSQPVNSSKNGTSQPSKSGCCVIT